MEEKFITKQSEFYDKKLVIRILSIAKTNRINLRLIAKKIIQKKADVINMGKIEIKLNGSDEVQLRMSHDTITLGTGDFLKLIANTLDITEKVLPQGSIVTLKSEFMQNLGDPIAISKLKFIVIDRYIKSNSEKYFFDYSIISYPVGAFGNDISMKITPNLIKNVLHEGYTSDEEKLYVELQKDELLIENDYQSISYCKKDVADRVAKELER